MRVSTIIDTLVTDRTSAVDYAVSDVNRVECAVAYLVDGLNTLGGFNLSLYTKTDWGTDAQYIMSDMERYRSNIAAIRAAYTQLDSTPTTPGSMDGLNWSTANDIEQILLDVEDALGRMAKSWFYPSEIYGGEV